MFVFMWGIYEEESTPEKRQLTQSSGLKLQSFSSHSFSQVLCSCGAEAEAALGNMATMLWYHTVQAPQEIQEFLAWQQDLESDSKSPTQARPTVFRWAGTAKEVFVSGSFNNWATKIPLNRRWCNTCRTLNKVLGPWTVSLTCGCFSNPVRRTLWL